MARTSHDNAICEPLAVEVGSGNVFADLGFADATELDLKVRLAVEIGRLIDARHLSPVATAALLGINRLKISALKKYSLDGFSAEELITLLARLDRT